MTELLITSSALILAVLALRRLFRGRISRRAQYALWGLVLLRLLLPVNLPAVEFSLLSAAEPAGQAVSERLEGQAVYRVPLESPSPEPSPESGTAAPAEPGPAPVQTIPAPKSSESGEDAFRYPVAVERVVTAADLLTALWIAGMAAMAAWFLGTNLRFWRKLRQGRTPYTVDGCPYPVYLMAEGLPSPCLFGLLRPAIYLTPAAVASPERLRHVIAHESAHVRHLDPLWSLLRSVCLTVWWFNPLVWVAACVSRADGELACDESAVRSLGETERIPYGRTLLALIPVRRSPASPLLSATTMTADKRRLKERITRIAQGGQPKAAALILVLALALTACAVTFTGASEDGSEPRPLTGDELAYFNEEFFNHDTVDGTVGVNIRNQFLTSLYERPEDLNLFELFYCGTGAEESMSPEELRQVGSFDTEGGLICPVDKMSVEAIDQVLRENTGLTLEETERIGMENFQYLPDYAAYYHSHGDTNYFHSVQITAGEREGDTIRLYYQADSGRWYQNEELLGGWACVTLEAQDDGSYWFVSNQLSEKPVIPTVLPEGDPALTISLADLEPTGSGDGTPVPVTPHQDDCADQGYGIGVTAENGEDVSIYPYLSTDGNVYVAVVYARAAGTDLWDAGCFLTLPEGNSLTYGESDVSLDFFHDLFGHDGVVVSYRDPLPMAAYQGSAIHAYYYFDDEANPCYLTSVYGGDTAILDLDGDGENELLSDSGQLVFQRDGQRYTADLEPLLRDQWEGFTWWNDALIDTSRRCLTVTGFMGMPEWGEGAQCDFFRDVYFDGESLLLYDDLEDTVDHMTERVASADLPEQVVSDAKAAIQAEYESRSGGAEGGDYDDWRVSSLYLAGTYTDYPAGPIEVYALSFQFHAADPVHTVLAGGMYLQADGWVGGINGYPYLVYQVREDGSRARLESSLTFDYSVDSVAYRADLCDTLLNNGLITWGDLSGEDLFCMFYMNQNDFLNGLSAAPADEQETALAALAAYGSASDPDWFQGVLWTLRWRTDGLTAAGLETCQRLLAIANGETPPPPPTEVDLQAAILDHRVNATAHQYAFSTEAHRVLDTVQDGDACTVYLLVWYSAYERTATGWQAGTDGQFPAAVTFAWRDGGWEVTDYREPASYAADLRDLFPEELADTVVNGDTLWESLREECRENAEAYFAEHPASASPVEDGAAGS